MAGYEHLEIPDLYSNIVKEKKRNAAAYYHYFLARLSRMFEYKNLPDTIPHEIMDRYLMNNGIACITKVNDKLYCFYGNLGGPQDVYYRPTLFIVSNPHIKAEDGQLFTANIPVCPLEDSPVDMSQPTEQQGVLIRNDTEWLGLAPMLSRYSYLMAENVLTLRTADVMLRITALITAPSDKERAAAEEYIKALEQGNLKVIGESPFFDGIKLQSPPSNNGSYLTQFIEYQQYLKGSIFNELGLVANYNMKREAIGKGESTLDQDSILPLADNMLLCRQEDLARVNKLFGTDISVQFSSAWLENLIETKSSLISMSQLNGAPNGAFQPSQPNESTQGTGDGADEQNRANGAYGANEVDATEDTKEGDDPNETEESGRDEADDSNAGADDGKVVEEGDSDDDSDESTHNPESEINDIASQGFLEEMNDKLDEKLDKIDEEKGDDINVNAGETESTEDQDDNSND